MIFSEPQSFDEAASILREKGLLPTGLSSKELSGLSSELKNRAFFSARVTNAEFLQKARDLTEKIAGGIAEDGGTPGATDARMVSIAEAKAQLAEFLRGIGYSANPDDEGTIKDLLSDARLSLIVETNVLDAQGRARYVASQDEVELDVTPAWELVRMVQSKEPRDWEERWASALDATTTEGATPPGSGRMVALKNHPVWQALGNGAGGYEDTLGNPWPPFAFNSGMNVIDVARDEAIELGLMTDNTAIPPVEVEAPDPEQSITRLDASVRAALAEDPALLLDGEVLRMRSREN